jgi:hypothetical protein
VVLLLDATAAVAVAVAALLCWLWLLYSTALHWHWLVAALLRCGVSSLERGLRFALSFFLSSLFSSVSSVN